jgi:hypothetical protein
MAGAAVYDMWPYRTARLAELVLIEEAAAKLVQRLDGLEGLEKEK